MLTQYLSKKSRQRIQAMTFTGGLLFTSMSNAQTTVVGSIPAEFSVNNGSVSYSIPIQVAPGRGGMQPDLSLEYTEGGNGILGVGWSLGGLSSIHRCTANIEQDGFIAGITFSNQDRYCLDGQRLIPINGANGAVSTEYRTEIDGYAQIKSYGGSANNPDYWIAKTKAGQVITFGGGVGNVGSASLQFPQGATSWSVREINDTTGNNPITYDYFIDQNVQYLNQIDYGEGQVSITYESRPDVLKSNVVGTDASIEKRVKNLLIASMGIQNSQTYSLSYSISPVTNQSQLVSVGSCSHNGSCLKPIALTWLDGERNFLQNTLSPLHSSWTNLKVLGQGDFNGDGLTDFYINHSNMGVGATQRIWYGKTDNTGFEQVSLSPLPSSWTNLEIMGQGDFNGDGLTDFYINHSNMGVGATQRVWYGKADNTGFEQVSLPPLPSSWTNLKILGQGDFNGDGLTDLYINHSNMGVGATQRVWYGKADKTGFEQVSLPPLSSSWTNFKIFGQGDFNGDGLTDFYLNHSNMGVGATPRIWYGKSDKTGFEQVSLPPLPSSWTNFEVMGQGDFNGDGLTDFYINHSNMGVGATQYIWYSKGDKTGFEQVSLPPLSSSWTNLRILGQGDFNGDGLTDFYINHSNMGVGATQRIWYGKTDKTGFEQVSLPPLPSSWTNLEIMGQGDFNGDGLTDFYINHSNMGVGAPQRIWYGGQSLPKSNLAEISDSAGNTTAINYQPLTNSSIYTKGTGAQYPVVDLQYPRYVVSSVTTDNGIGGTSTVNYQYEGLKAHVRGRGSYGFAKVTESYSDTGKSLETYYNQTGFPLVGYVDQVIEKLNGQTINESTKSYVVNQNYSDVYSVNLSQSVDKSYELNGDLVTTVSTANSNIDLYGNIGTVSVTTSGNGESFTKITQSQYSNDTANWYLGRLTEATVTHQAPSQSDQQRRSQFAYDSATGLLETESIVSIATGLPLTTTQYTYDSYGQKTQVTRSASGQNRTSSTTYNSHGRPTQTCNGLNQCETYTYTSEGWLASTTGPNGITTSWQYDGFGRKTKETRADGTETTIARHFSSDGQCGNLASHAYTCTVSQTTGSQPIIVQQDTLGREVRKVVSGFDGRSIYSDTEYNSDALVARVSRNYFAGDQIYWANSSYDALDRVVSMDEPGPHGSRTVINTIYDGLTTTVRSGPEQREKVTVTNAIGQVIHRNEEEGSYVDYTYTADGNLQTTQIAGSAASIVSLSYDEFGRKIAMNDPDMGQWSYTYNGFGELISQTDAKGQTTTMQYDVLGRLISRTEPEGTSAWVYGDNSAPQGSVGKLLSESNSGMTKTYFYDTLGRPIETLTDITGEQVFSTQTLYDSIGRVSRTIYPGSDNFYTENVYNPNGFLEKVQGLRSNSEQYDLSQLTPLVTEALDLAQSYQTQANDLRQIGLEYQAKIAEYQSLIDSGTTSGSLDSSLQSSLSQHETLLNDSIAKATFDEAPLPIFGTPLADNLVGVAANERFYSSGMSVGTESIRGNGGRDVLVLDADDSVALDTANDSNGHIRVRDWIIGDIHTNSQADILELYDLLSSNTQLNANNIGDYLHVVSSPYGYYSRNRTGVFVNREGNFTAADRAALTANVVAGGHGADLYLEFQGQSGDNNFSTITGHADNTVAQFQALIDLGFLRLSIADESNVAYGSTSLDHLNNTLIELQTVTDLITTQVQTYENTVEQLVVLAEQTLAAADNSFQYERTLVRGANAYTELVNDNQYTTYWRAIDVDASGRISAEVYGNGMVNDYVYNQATGQLQQINSGLLAINPERHLEYQYDAYQNVTLRHDLANDIRETFEYDRLDRLTRTDVVSDLYNYPEFNGSQTQDYDVFGNIIYKSDVGHYSYGAGNAGIHAVTSAGGNTYTYDANGNMLSGDGRSLTWSSFNKPTLITKNGKSAAFEYGADRARYKKVNHNGDKTLYVGSLYEYQTRNSGADTEEKHYIYANGQLVAEHIVSTQAGVQTRYLHKDALGSVDLVTDAYANVVDRRSFDAWGKLRNLLWKDNQGINDPLYLVQLPYTNKGFTGHEHVQEVDVIHMNGRVYDATLARFMSADPHIQEGALTQSYNRYSYVMNNPLKYTDPSGYFFKKIFRAVKKIVKKVAKAVKKVVKAIKPYVGVVVGALVSIYCQVCGSGIIKGALAGAAAGAAGAAANGGNILKGALTGAISGATFAHIGGLEGISDTTRVAYHALAGGAMNVIQGGKFGAGFLSAGFAKFATLRLTANGAFDMSKQDFGSVMGRTTVAAVVGGTASEIGGGKFKNGATTAAMAHLLNAEFSNMRANAIKQQGMNSKEALESEIIKHKFFLENFQKLTATYSSAVTAVTQTKLYEKLPMHLKEFIKASGRASGALAKDSAIHLQEIIALERERLIRLHDDIERNKPENIDGYLEYGVK